MSKRWTVYLTNSYTHDVGADSVQVSSGALVFYKDETIIAAYSAPRWSELTYEGEE